MTWLGWGSGRCRLGVSGAVILVSLGVASPAWAQSDPTSDGAGEIARHTAPQLRDAAPDDTPPPPPPPGDSAIADEPSGAGVLPRADRMRGDPDLEAPYPRRRHFVVRTSAGASLESLASKRIVMGGGEIAFGADTRRAGLFGVIGAEGGQTEQNLDVWHIHLAGDFEWPIGPIRLGVEPRFGFLSLERPSHDSHALLSTIGIGAILGADLFRSGSVTLGLRVVPRAEIA